MQEGRTAALPCELSESFEERGGDPCETLPPCLLCALFQPQRTLGACLRACRIWFSTRLCLSRLYEQLWHTGCRCTLQGGRVLKSWAKAPGVTEQTKCDNAVAAVRKAIAASDKLSKLKIKVEAQGSYYNRTNVREDSDVDVRVQCSDSFFFELPNGLTNVDCGFVVPGPVNYATFKNDVGAALASHFKSLVWEICG
jgi:hypothetical protein